MIKLATAIDAHYGKYKIWYKFLIFPVSWILGVYSLAIGFLYIFSWLFDRVKTIWS